MSENVFHEGERRVQQLAGETQEADRIGPMISANIPAGAIPFLQEQSLLILAILDNGAMWCLPIAGKSGWMSTTRKTIHLDLNQTIGSVDERILSAADHQQLVGGITLDFATRRRLRMNGRLKRVTPDGLLITVAEAYPNCPKYITQRTLVWSDNSPQSPSLEGESLTDELRDAIRKTDTLFVATQHPERGLDASHRGGDPGFVECPSDKTLRIPDYAGNNLFNTLGNLEVDSRVGILVPRFNGRGSIAISGTATVHYEDEGRIRWMTVTVQRWALLYLPAMETSRQLSPFNP